MISVGRKFLLAASSALALVSAASGAQWTQVSKDDFSTIYMDPASKKALPDGAVSVDALTDYDPNSPHAGPFRLSEKGLSEIESVLLDCAKGNYRSQGGAWRDGRMGEGRITKSYPPGDSWSSVPVFYEGLFEKVCPSK